MYERYCQRCRRYHNSPPVDPKKILDELSKELAREIDKEILEKLRGDPVASEF